MVEPKCQIQRKDSSGALMKMEAQAVPGRVIKMELYKGFLR